MNFTEALVVLLVFIVGVIVGKQYPTRTIIIGASIVVITYVLVRLVL